ncbi:MAG TPA: hypothetical protein PK855_06160 [Bacteroidales bacterium]|nr:hypothetical protein [Bacteroidales bacterium]
MLALSTTKSQREVLLKYNISFNINSLTAVLSWLSRYISKPENFAAYPGSKHYRSEKLVYRSFSKIPAVKITELRLLIPILLSINSIKEKTYNENGNKPVRNVWCLLFNFEGKACME